MTHEVVILFCHHDKNRAVTEEHYHSFVRDNPAAPVIPLTFDGPDWLPHGVRTVGLESVWPGPGGEEYDPAWPAGKRNSWRWACYDRALILRYLRSPHRVEARRYVIFEWDTLSHGLPVQDYYGGQWGADAAGAHLFTRKTLPGWSWWHWPAVRELGEDAVLGVVPVCGMLLSGRAADGLAHAAAPRCLDGSFSEFFLPTMLKHLGFTVSGMGHRRDMITTYGGPLKLDLNRKAIYHPVAHTLDELRRRPPPAPPPPPPPGTRLKTDVSVISEKKQFGYAKGQRPRVGLEPHENGTCRRTPEGP